MRDFSRIDVYMSVAGHLTHVVKALVLKEHSIRLTDFFQLTGMPCNYCIFVFNYVLCGFLGNKLFSIFAAVMFCYWMVKSPLKTLFSSF